MRLLGSNRPGPRRSAAETFSRRFADRYLARLTRAGLENFLECSDPEAPRLCSVRPVPLGLNRARACPEATWVLATDTELCLPCMCQIADGNREAPIKLGSDSPDNLYQSAVIDSRRTYVVSGNRGTVRHLGFGTQSGQYGGPGGLQTVDYVEANALTYDNVDAGSFKITLSAERPSGQNNWLRLEPKIPSAMFIVRQTFGDRQCELAASLKIECLDGKQQPSPLTPARLDEALRSTGMLVAGASMMFARWAAEFQSHQNQLPLFDPIRSNRAGGDPKIRYHHSYWRLPEGMVMRIRFVPIRCRMWNFQVCWYSAMSWYYLSQLLSMGPVIPAPNYAKLSSEPFSLLSTPRS